MPHPSISRHLPDLDDSVKIDLLHAHHAAAAAAATTAKMLQRMLHREVADVVQRLDARGAAIKPLRDRMVRRVEELARKVRVGGGGGEEEEEEE
jgi:hypothetical protein